VNIHSTLSSSRGHIKETAYQDNSDASRRKKLRLTARPRCLVDQTLHRPAEHHVWLPGHDPLYIIARCQPDTFPPHGNRSPTAANIAGEGPVTLQLTSATEPQLTPQPLYNIWDIHKRCYMCVTVTVITSNPTVIPTEDSGLIRCDAVLLG
jgi:hypothetical protein